MPQRGAVLLTGDAEVGDVRSGKTFYGDDIPTTKLTGTLDFPYTVGNQIVFGNEASENLTSDVWIKQQSFLINHNISDTTIRIRFMLQVQNEAWTVWGCIRRDGGAVGTERSTTSTEMVFFSEDITGWNLHEEIELWLKGSSDGQNRHYGGYLTIRSSASFLNVLFEEVL